MTKKYLNKANSAFEKGGMLVLAKTLFNMPSNLYPGDHKNNEDIGDNTNGTGATNIDPPKEGIEIHKKSKGKDRIVIERIKSAGQVAQGLFKKYQPYGLTKKGPDMAKTSDKPDGDGTGDYVSI